MKQTRKTKGQRRWPLLVALLAVVAVAAGGWYYSRLERCLRRRAGRATGTVWRASR